MGQAQKSSKINKDSISKYKHTYAHRYIKIDNRQKERQGNKKKICNLSPNFTSSCLTSNCHVDLIQILIIKMQVKILNILLVVLVLTMQKY